MGISSDLASSFMTSQIGGDRSEQAGETMMQARTIQAGFPLATTRRAAIALGGGLAGLATGGGLWSIDARKKGKKRKKKKKFKTILELAAPEMTGAKEIPAASGDDTGEGSGECTIQKKGNDHRICCEFTFSSGTDEEISGFHIHKGPPDEDGGIVIDFNGDLDTCKSITKALADEIKDDPTAFYANIHTSAFPDGAVRDQLEIKA